MPDRCSWNDTTVQAQIAATFRERWAEGLARLRAGEDGVVMRCGALEWSLTDLRDNDDREMARISLDALGEHLAAAHQNGAIVALLSSAIGSIMGLAPEDDQIPPGPSLNEWRVRRLHELAERLRDGAPVTGERTGIFAPEHVAHEIVVVAKTLEDARA